MKTLIAYASKYGCTEKCGNLLGEKLKGEFDLHNLKTGESIDFSKYEKVIIGGSIYMGKIQKEVTEFCSKNLVTLKNKKLGLFICNMREGDLAQTELESSFPQELQDLAISKEYLGGEFKISKMNFMDRLITKKIAKVDKDKSDILYENIDRFVRNFNVD